MTKTRQVPNMSSTCKFCEAKIYWATDKERRTKVPLDFIGDVIVLEGLGVCMKPQWGFVRHLCDPEALEAYREREEQRQADQARKNAEYATERELQRRISGHYRKVAPQIQAAREKFLEEAIDARDCPKCGAPAGTDCYNLTQSKMGKTVYKLTPHDERAPGWEVPVELRFRDED